jgi:hypothetical protein
VPRFALHCSHEQHAPSRLLHSIQRAEEADFSAGMSHLRRMLDSLFALHHIGQGLDPLGEHVLPELAA